MNFVSPTTVKNESSKGKDFVLDCDLTEQDRSPVLNVVISGRKFQLSKNQCLAIPLIKKKLQADGIFTDIAAEVQADDIFNEADDAILSQISERKLSLQSVCTEDSGITEDSLKSIDSISKPRPDSEKSVCSTSKLRLHSQISIGSTSKPPSQKPIGSTSKPRANSHESMSSNESPRVPIQRTQERKHSERRSFSSAHHLSSRTGEDIKTFHCTRNVAVFESILDFAQHGQLHAPLQVCPTIFVRDLEFWGLDLGDLEPCCYMKVASFVQEQEMLGKFCRKLNIMAATAVCNDGGGGGVSSSFYRRQRNRFWLFLTEPTSSLAAKVYFVILCFVILLSFFVIAAGTTDYFTRGLTKTEWKEYLGRDQFHNYYEHFKRMFPEDYFDNGYEYDPSDYETASSPPLSSSAPAFSRTPTTATTPTQPNHQPTGNPRAIVDPVKYLGMICSALLLLELVVRVIVCPSLRHFFCDVINLCDLAAGIAAVLKYVVDVAVASEKFDDGSATTVINSLQLLRVLRLFGPMSKVRGFQAVVFTLRSSLWQLLLILAVNGLLVLVFSALLYHLGDRQSMASIPTAMWYALVTMTTVGYGDVVPQGFFTKVLGAACALCGVLLLAMTLPIVANNFFLIYNACSAMPRRRGATRSGGNSRCNAFVNSTSPNQEAAPEAPVKKK